jgi:hypothetical protein
MTDQDKPTFKVSSPTIFAFGLMLGVVIMLLLVTGDHDALRLLPVRYEHCSNYPGVAASCEVRARFQDKLVCEDYRKHVWGDHEPDTTRTYCRESK